MKNTFTRFLLNALRNSLTIVLFFLLSTNVFSQEETYQVQDTEFSIVGSGKLEDWKPLIEQLSFDGKFLAKDSSLTSINNLKYSFGVNDKSIKKTKTTNIINGQMLAANNNKFAFAQENMMILPILKMAHLTMDVNTVVGNHFSPLVLKYEKNADQSIRVKGTQVIWLYQLGIIPRNIKDCHADDKITLNINFTLVKEANFIAKAFIDDKL